MTTNPVEPDGARADTKLPITAIVMTLNEERNLEACLQSVVPFIEKVFVVDCGSTDGTRDIAARFGCTMIQHEWVNYGAQFQWALNTLPIATEWVLRLDADERWLPEGFRKLAAVMSDQAVSGIEVRMKIMFMGRWMRHGGLYPNNFLRVFRHKRASIEQRWMDEHVRVDGRTVNTDIDVIEANYDRQQNLGLWTTKHNSYSTREAADALIATHRLGKVDSIANVKGGKTERKRWVKDRLYMRMPLFARASLYFTYRYFIRLGFLDGVPGLVFHVLQGFWYRFLVDAKVYQVEREARRRGTTIAAIMRDTYGIDL